MAAMIRRRPIPKTSAYPEQSLRYEVIMDGAVRVYPDGREVCQDNPQGWREYKRRVEVMVQRQDHRCSLCNRRLALAQATFEHQRRRGMHAAFRDDRIELPDATWINGAAHWVCNGVKG